MVFKKKTVTERKTKPNKQKVNKVTLAPSSEAHRIFLNCKSDFVIFGGGENSASTIKTTL